MSGLRTWRLTRGARRDAGQAVDSAEARILAELGPRPVFDPTHNHRHAMVSDALLLGPRIEERQGDLMAQEDERGRHHPLWLFRLLLGAAIGVDALGGFLVMRALDVPEQERWPLGIALAFLLILLTAAVAKSSSVEPSKKRWRGLLLPLAYAVLVGSVAVVRLGSIDAEVSSAELIAETAIMLGCSIGPAFFVETLYHRFAPARSLDEAVKNLRQRLAHDRRAYLDAQRFMTKLADRQAAWDEAASRLRAAYLIEFRLAGDRRDDTSANSSTGISARRS